MTARPESFPDEDLHAFIDGELDAPRALLIEQALQDDAALAARAAAFASDKHDLAALYAPIAEAPIPDAWRARIEAATAPAMAQWQPARRPVWRRGPVLAFALAACLAVFALTTLLRPSPADTILADAAAARRDETPALVRLAGPALADEAGRTAALRYATGLAVRAPGVLAQRWHLVELETYTHAAALRYRSDTGQALTLYVRPSAGAPRFDLLRDGTLRTCIWQDEVVGAVMMGDMSAGQMMRVASAAYLALNL